MEPSTSQSASIRFQGWEIRPAERRLLVEGQPLTVGGRAFDLLLALVSNAGRTVGKADLLDAAWPGLVVEENNVSVQIAALRKLLGADVITTVAGLGYRLSALPEVDRPAAAVERRAAPPRESDALLGRDDDVQAIVRELGVARLVSIIGTGGVGKTVLAKAVLRRHQTASGRGHWVDLSPLRERGQIAPLVAHALGIDLEGRDAADDELATALASAQAFIVVDNCEHLLDGVARLLGKALAQAPGVRWLITSQEPVHIAGEVIYRLGPLGVPPAGTALSDVMGFGAVSLLCCRVLAADRHFALSGSNAATAVDLCRQLDGLPLAIEMAAARVATLGLESVYRQLDQRLRLLVGPRDAPERHHTLRSTLDWGYSLLSAEEKAVFRRLQPFVGGFTVPMANAVTGESDAPAVPSDTWQTMEVLSALVDKSFLQRSAGRADRFFLYESARDYASERLAEAHETETVRRRHAHAVAAVLDRAAQDVDTLRDAQWIALYVPERHNALAAIDWACETKEADVLAVLVAALARMDALDHLPPEAVRLDVPLALLRSATPARRAAACLELSWAHYSDGNRALATELSSQALDDFQQIGDVGGAYRALAQLVRLYESRPGMHDEALRAWARLREIDDSALPLRTRLMCTICAGLQHGAGRTLDGLHELEDLAQRSGFDALAAICRVHITDELLIAGRFDDVVQTAERFLRAGEARPRARALILSNQSLALVQLGRHGEAREPAMAALRAFPSATHVILATFALAAVRERRFADAAVVFGYADRARRARDESPDPAEALAIAETATQLAAALGSQRADALAQTSAGMGVTQILELAMRVASAPRATDDAPSAPPGRSF